MVTLILCAAVAAADGPSVGGSLGVGAMYLLELPTVNGAVAAEVPILPTLSAQVSVRAAGLPFALRREPPFFGLWRLSTTAGVVQRFVFDRFEVGLGGAAVAGIGTILVTEVEPPLAPDFGLALIGQGRWRFTDSLSLRLGLLLPVTLLVMGPSIGLFTHPELHGGLSWDFAWGGGEPS